MDKVDVALGDAPARVSTPASTQYSLRRIAGIWALATLPTVLLAWGVAPTLIGLIGQPAALTYWLLLMLGALWQTTLGLLIIRREEGDLRWSTIRRRVRLNAPLQPKTGRRRARAFLGAPLGWLAGLLSLGLGVLLANRMALARISGRVLQWGLYTHTLAPAYAQVTELASPEFAGRRGLVALAILSWALSALLAEELIFRGLLLPRMAGAFGRWDSVPNAGLSGLSHLYKPWMIPFRFVYGLAIAGPAKRYRSYWLAACAHAVEGAALLALVVAGVRSSPLSSLPAAPAFPQVSARPGALTWYRGALAALPHYDPDSDASWQVDLRGHDLSGLDLRDAGADLAYADFDARTVWPTPERMPADFDPQQVLETGKNPGLGVRGLHAAGISGRGVGIAIVDQRLLTEHEEYAGQLRWYEEVGGLDMMESAQMHGAAVASVAVGKTVGVAPEADLYFIGVCAGAEVLFMQKHEYAQAIRRILEINRALPQERRIRVISISLSWSRWDPGYYDITAAVNEAKAQGILVVSSSLRETYGFQFHGFGRAPLADPDRFQSYGPGLWWARNFFAGQAPLPETLLVPMDSRTTASPSGSDEYVFYRSGGWSWSIPYLAGAYALAAQVEPDITPERFWSLALQTGRTIEIEQAGQAHKLGTILDPPALVRALSMGR